MSILILAIDFGTTTTVVCGDLQGTGNPMFIKDENSSLIPSLIYVKDDGTRYYGKRAEIEQERGLSHGYAVENFKIGLLANDNDKYKEYVKDFLKNHIYKLYEQQKIDFPQHRDVIIRISHPSKWSNELIQFMIEAVKYAGFAGKVETVAEPLAISTYSLLSYQEDLKNKKMLKYYTEYICLICDMGGGTTDVVLCKASIDGNGRCRINDPKTYPKQKSKINCGGSEMDIILKDYVLEKLPENLRKIFSIHNAKLWKEQYVSKDLEANKISETPSRIMSIMSVIPEYQDRSDLSDICSIDRKRYHEISSDYWSELVELVDNSVSDYCTLYDVKPSNVDFLILTGGHSQWYCISELLLSRLPLTAIKNEPTRILKCPNPNETVARGLCAYDKKIICNNSFDEVIKYKAYFTVTNHNVKNSNECFILLDRNVVLPFSLNFSDDSVITCDHSLKNEVIEFYIDIYIGNDTLPFKSVKESYHVGSYDFDEYKIQYNFNINIDEKKNINISVNCIEPSWSGHDVMGKWDDFDDEQAIYCAHIDGL